MEGKKRINRRTGKKVLAETVALSMCVGLFQPGGASVLVHAADGTGNGAIYEWDFADGTQDWKVSDWGDKDAITVSNGQERLKAEIDYSAKTGEGWAESATEQFQLDNVNFAGADSISFDFYYKEGFKTTGELTIKGSADANVNGTEKGIITDDCIAVTDNADLPSEALEDGWTKKTVTFKLEGVTGDSVPAKKLVFLIVGRNTDYKGAVYFDNIKIFKSSDADKGYVNSSVKVQTNTSVSGNNTALSVNGENINYTNSVKLADDKADAGTVALYQYLEAVGKSSSVIYGHMEDTVLKAGAAELTYSDTEDITGSISALDGIDCGDLFAGFAEKFIARYPEEAAGLGMDKDNITTADNIKAAAEFSNKSIKAGALMTLSAHMPNFAYAEKKENADSIEKAYDRFDYSKANSNNLTGDCMNNILPGGKFNEAYTSYLDLIAEYASQVDGTILFRPLHENTGSWFWWGSAFCSADTYKNVFKYTADYLRNVKNVHNLLYLYGPGSEAATEAEYEERYPGDGYVDLLGFDSYDDNPTNGTNYTFQENFKNTIRLTNSFAKKHNKLFAVTETGIRNPGDKGLVLTGNGRKDWYNEILDIVTDKEFNCCYFMLWSNYSSSGAYYTPFVVNKNEDGTFTGHEMTDNFISFYNDKRSIFASDQKDVISGLESINKPEVSAKELDGYITSPATGTRILNETTVHAQLNMETDKSVSIHVSGNGKDIELKTSRDEAGMAYSAAITKENLDALGETLQGKIALYADNQLLQEINVIFNVEEKVMTNDQVDDFETYGGLTNMLVNNWSTNKDSGCTVDISLVEEPHYEGSNALKFTYNETKNGWGGATIAKEADWSSYNALRFWVKPDGKNQKTVVQISSGGSNYEAYLNLYDDYAKSDTPLLVTLPFSEFKNNNGTDTPLGGEALKSISGFGLWVNAIPESEAFANNETMVTGTLYYDDIRVVSASTDKPVFEKPGDKPVPGTVDEVFHTGRSEISSDYSAQSTIPESFLNEAKEAGISDITLRIGGDIVNDVKSNKNKRMVIKAIVPQVDGVSLGKAILEEEAIKNAVEGNRKLVIKILNEDPASSYTVTIPPSELKKMQGDIDISIKAGNVSEAGGNRQKNIESILSDNGINAENAAIVSIASNNTKGGIKASAPVANAAIKAGGKVYVYRYNSSTGKLEEIANSARTVLKNGMTGIEGYSGNDYVVTNKGLSGKNVVTLLGQSKVKFNKASVKKGGKIKINTTLPEELKAETSLKNKVPYAKQAAVVTYKSSNTKVAEVSKNGTVNATGKGKATITVNIKLADGKVKTVKKEVTVE